MKSFKLALIGSLLLVNALCGAELTLADIGAFVERRLSSQEREATIAVEVTNATEHFGPSAIPYLLLLLGHEDPRVRRVATDVLYTRQGFDESHLDALIASKRRGNEPMAVPIAKVGTPRAIAFLVDELKRQKDADYGIYRAFQILGDKSVPYLLPLIEEQRLSKKQADRIVAVFTWLNWRAKSAVDPLTQFIAARRGNKKATQCAVRVLGAIGQVARPSAPALVKLAEDDPRSYREVVDEALVAMAAPEAVGIILRHLDDDSDKATRDALNEFVDKAEHEALVDPLIAFVSGREGGEKALAKAVDMLGRFDAEHRSVPVLLELAEKNPEAFGTAVDRALLQMAVPQAMPGVLRRLETEDDPFYYYGVSRLGETGRAPGPALVRRLRDDYWGTRCGAASALGYIGYTEAGPDLIELLSDEDDWRLAFAAAKSLGRLKLPEAAEPLTELSQTHWYPPVRQAATKALRVIAGEATYELQTGDSTPPLYGNPYRDFFEYDWLTLFGAPEIADSELSDPGPAHIRQAESLDTEQLAKLRYKAERYSGDSPWQVPDIGIAIDGGYLVGSDRGEWGGELAFIDSKGKQTIVRNGNVYGIYRMSYGIGVIGWSGGGLLLKVSREEDGSWQVRPWKALPGGHRASSMLANGDLWIDCYGGCIQISPDGDIKMVRRQ